MMDAFLGKVQQTGLFRYQLDETAWRQFLVAADHKIPLLAAWADEQWATMLLLDNESPLLLSTKVIRRRYYAPSSRYPAAVWGEVMARDLWGVEAIAARDEGLSLDEGAWTLTWPLAKGSLAVQGDVVAVRDEKKNAFSVPFSQTGVPGLLGVQGQLSGGKMQYVSFHLSAAHRGLALQIRGKSPSEALRIIHRVSAGGFIAHPLAFVRAVEQAEGRTLTACERDRRFVLLEMERISLHLFDLGQMAHYAGVMALASCCAHMREALACLYEAHHLPRRLTDMIGLAGEKESRQPDIEAAAQAATAFMKVHLPQLVALYMLFANRFAGVARLSTETAWRYAVGGVSGRASGRHIDMRRGDFRMRFDSLRASGGHEGCALARGQQRLAEMRDSVAVIQRILDDSSLVHEVVSFPVTGEGIAVAEGARGDVWYWLRLKEGKIETVHLRDPALPLLGALCDVVKDHKPEDLALVLSSFGLSPAGAAF